MSDCSYFARLSREKWIEIVVVILNLRLLCDLFDSTGLALLLDLCVCMYVSLYLCMYLCIYVCIYVSRCHTDFSIAIFSASILSSFLTFSRANRIFLCRSVSSSCSTTAPRAPDKPPDTPSTPLWTMLTSPLYDGSTLSARDGEVSLSWCCLIEDVDSDRCIADMAGTGGLDV